MANSGRKWAIVAGVGLLTGCYRLPELEYPKIPVASRRVAALPSQGIVWVYDFDGKRTLDEAMILKAQQNIDDSITYRLRRYGGRSFSAEAIDRLEHMEQFRRWVADAMLDITAERMAITPRVHETVGEFRFSQSLSGWRPALDADFVLVTTFLDGHNSLGRVLAVTLAGGGWLATRRAMSCAVHLESGRIVWCNEDSQLDVDLTQRFGAQQEVDDLLETMLSEGESVQSEPLPPLGNEARIKPRDDVAPPPPPPPPEPERRL